MGFNADITSARGRFYLSTDEAAPYCGKIIMVTVWETMDPQNFISLSVCLSVCLTRFYGFYQSQLL